MKVNFSKSNSIKMKTIANHLITLGIISMIFLAQGCKKGTIPVLTTTDVTEVTANTAISGGNISDDGGCDILDKGVCWNKTGDPTINDPKASSGKGTGSFESTISGLESGTKYFVRAYASNEPGTAYGETVEFTTKIADIDGNLYNFVTIGTQVWLVENLKTTKLNDNSAISHVPDNTAWSTLPTAGYAWYNNDEDYNKPIYGALYNWHAVNSGKLCPSGWHVPTDNDYKTLEQNLGLTLAELDIWGWRGTDQGSKLKSTSGWNTGETGNNSTGFTALPGGYRFYATGGFDGQNTLGYWWTASEHDAARAWYRRLDGNNTGIYRASTDKGAGKSVRCVKN